MVGTKDFLSLCRPSALSTCRCHNSPAFNKLISVSVEEKTGGHSTALRCPVILKDAYSNSLINSFNKFEAIKRSVKIFQINFEHFSSLAHIICLCE